MSTKKLWEELLEKHVAVQERVQEIRDEEDAMKTQLAQCDFTTPEGVSRALELKGLIRGLARAHDILTEKSDD